MSGFFCVLLKVYRKNRRGKEARHKEKDRDKQLPAEEESPFLSAPSWMLFRNRL